MLQKPLKELSRLCRGGNTQNNIVTTNTPSETRVSLPLLQVWPSESPRGEADGQAQAFIFPDVQENVNDSGIESIQVVFFLLKLKFRGQNDKRTRRTLRGYYGNNGLFSRILFLHKFLFCSKNIFVRFSIRYGEYKKI